MTDTDTTTALPPLIEARGMSKRYGTIVANDDVDVEIGRGEIVAIVGDNGAGKSTFAKMLSGAVTPDAGELRVEGKLVSLRSPIEARAHGIETIYQDLAMAPNLDVVSNLYLGRERLQKGPGRLFGVVDRRRMRSEVSAHLDDLDINIPKLWGTPVESLSGGQRQSVAIARALVWASKLVIMDEPTAALGVRQSAAVLRIAKRIRDLGISVVIISHILPHVLELADRVVVLRHGRKVADVAAADLDEHKLIEMIVGIRAATPNGAA